MRSTFLQGLPYMTFVVNILTVRFTFADLPILQINDVQFTQGMTYPVQVTGNEFKVGALNPDPDPAQPTNRYNTYEWNTTSRIRPRGLVRCQCGPCCASWACVAAVAPGASASQHVIQHPLSLTPAHSSFIIAKASM